MIHTPVMTQSFKLMAPYLPQSNKHGIGASAAADLRVHIDPWPEMDCGDLIELFWGGCYAASKLLSESDIGHTSVLHVPESFLRSGKVKTYYRVTKIGSEPIKSPGAKLWVKLETPGGQLVSGEGDENQGLAPATFAESVMQDGLTARHFDEGVQLTLDAYPNMDAYDEITLRWGDMRLDLPALTQDDVGMPIVVDVPAALVREAGDDPHLEVSYCVIDRVGNNSRWAPARLIKVSTDVLDEAEA